jgi:hypothetical protein
MEVDLEVVQGRAAANESVHSSLVARYRGGGAVGAEGALFEDGR